MAHAKASDLADIDGILKMLRELPLKEKSLGCFYFKGKGILHFHVKGNRRYGHVFNGEIWIEIDIESNLSPRKQIETFKKIRKNLLI